MKVRPFKNLCDLCNQCYTLASRFLTTILFLKINRDNTMKTNYLLLYIAAIPLLFSACNTTSPEVAMMEDLAESWIHSSYESKDAAYAMVSENMSESGMNIGSRYIGFGFNYNADVVDTDGMVVTNVIDGGPASSVLQEGDEFITVNGVNVTQETIDNGRLSFRGKPGEPVDAMIMRDGEMMSISVTRGIVEPTYTKAQILENISESDAESWGENSLGYDIREIVSDPVRRIVYLKTWDKFLDDVSGLEAESLTLTRFEFDQSGKVLSVGNMSEDALVLRQTGWSITR